jgi:hypothetical protein
MMDFLIGGGPTAMRGRPNQKTLIRGLGCIKFGEARLKAAHRAKRPKLAALSEFEILVLKNRGINYEGICK